MFTMAGIGVRDPSESAFRIPRNRCSGSIGIGVQDAPEYAPLHRPVTRSTPPARARASGRDGRGPRRCSFRLASAPGSGGRQRDGTRVSFRRRMAASPAGTRPRARSTSPPWGAARSGAGTDSSRGRGWPIPPSPRLPARPASWRAPPPCRRRSPKAARAPAHARSKRSYRFIVAGSPQVEQPVGWAGQGAGLGSDDPVAALRSTCAAARAC